MVRTGGVNTHVPVALQRHACARAPRSNPAQRGPVLGLSQGTAAPEHGDRTRVQGRRGRLSMCALLPWCKGGAQRPPHTRRAHAGAREGRTQQREGGASTRGRGWAAAA